MLSWGCIFTSHQRVLNDLQENSMTRWSYHVFKFNTSGTVVRGGQIDAEKSICRLAGLPE